MGKTNSPVKILVLDEELAASPELVELAAKGHDVRRADFREIGEFDLVIGRRAWHMTPAHLKYLDLAIKSARVRNKEAKKDGA